MDVYKKMWIERKKELLDRINKADSQIPMQQPEMLRN